MLLTIIVFTGCSVMEHKSQSSINRFDGVYVVARPVGMDTVFISGNTLLIRSDNINLSTGDPILAECRIEPSSKNYVKLYSTDIPFMAFNDLEVKYSSDNIADSVAIIIFFPNLDLPIKVELNDYYGNAKSVEHICETKRVELKIPSTIKSFFVTISPVNYNESSPLGAYYGLLTFSSWLKPIEVKSNKLEIYMPNIRKNIFERWYFNGNIASFDDGKLFFRDIQYTKIESL